MKPARFDYVRPDSVAQALEVLARYGGDAKIIAGGQSLMPMMNFRLVKPAVLVDINRIPGLELIEDRGDRLWMGALARHHMTATDHRVARRTPVLHAAMQHVAHVTIRNRGSFCGSLCHADPAAEIPMIALMLDGKVEIAAQSGTRILPVAEFLVSSLVTALEPDEMVIGITIGTCDPLSGWAFEEFSRRHGDFALAAVAVTLGTDADGTICNPCIGMTGVGETAMRMPGVEALLAGRHPDDGVLTEVADWLSDTLAPSTDIHASADYRRHLSGVLAGRAIRAAHARAQALAQTLALKGKPHD